MKIGFFKDAGEDKSIIGKIITRSLRFPYLVLRRVENPMSDKAPVYEIFERVQGDDEIQIGAVWERRMKATNDVFLTGLIDDPSMAEPLQIALFGSETDGFDVQWRRERDSAAFDGFGGSASNGTGQRRQSGGGFSGGSTAGPGGEYVGANRDLDDDVPF